MLANLSKQHMLYIAGAILIVVILVSTMTSKKKESFEEKMSVEIKDPLSATLTYRYDLLDNILSNMNNYQKNPMDYVNVVNGLLSLAYACKRIGNVRLFQDCDYNGNSAQFDIGEYRLADLRARGIENDSVSSIKIFGKLAVILYEHDNFEGSSVTISANDNCLNDNVINNFNFNDQVSSMKVISFPPVSVPTFDDFEHGGQDFMRNTIISLMFNLSEPFDAVVSLFTCFLINRSLDDLPFEYKDNKVILGKFMFKNFNEIQELKNNALTLEEYSTLIMKIISREFINNMVCNNIKRRDNVAKSSSPSELREMLREAREKLRDKKYSPPSTNPENYIIPNYLNILPPAYPEPYRP